MAGPLPRYDELGIRIASPGAYNPAGASAAAAVGQTLAQNVDRLVGFAFRQAEEEARIAGAEYGAANAPTPEQIRKAAETGTDLDIGSTGTVFGRAQRATTLQIAAQSMQTEALQKMAILRAETLKAGAPSDQYLTEVQSMIDGYGAAMERLSPSSAASLRASLSTTANSQYLAILEKEQARALATQKLQAVNAADLLIQSIDDDIAAGNRVDPKTGAVTTVDQLVALKRVQILKMAQATNDPAFAATKLQQLQEAVDKAKVATVATWAVDRSTGYPSRERLHSVMTGKFGDDDPTLPPEDRRNLASVKSMWSTMSPEQRVKAQDEVRRQFSAQVSLDAQVDAANERTRREAQARARIDFRKAWMSGDATAAETALREMERIGDSEGFEKHAPLVGQRYEFTAPGTMLELERDMVNNRLTEDRVIELVKERKLSDTDARAVIGKLDTVRDRRFQEAMSYVKGSLGYPDKGMFRIGGDAEDRKAEQQIARIQNMMIDERRKNPDADLFGIARREIDAAKAEKASIDNLNSLKSRVRQSQRWLGQTDGVPYEQLRQRAAAALSSRRVDSAAYNDFLKALSELEKLEPRNGP